MLDPNSYRMLAVSGTMYRNVFHSLTTWRISKSKISGAQFLFYPGRNTLQPMFILRHLQHAARTIKPSNSYRPHTAFIDFKQGYNTTSFKQAYNPNRLFAKDFGLISVANACLHLFFLLFKAYVQATITSYKTGIKLLRLSLLWV